MLLFGGTGFIGRHVQLALQQSGIPIRLAVRPGSRRLHNALAGADVRICRLDDRHALASAAEGVRAMVYAAGTVRGGTAAEFHPANVGGVETLLEARAQQARPAPLLLISSLAASRPKLSDYARSKWLAEQAVIERAAAPWTILRPTAVYGPGDREMLPLLHMLRRGFLVRLGPANQRVSLLHADDLADAVIAWLSAPSACNGGIYAIDDGHPGGYDWPAIASAAGRSRLRQLTVPAAAADALVRANLLLSRLVRRPPMLTPGKVRELSQAEWLCDNGEFSRATGWHPRVDLQQGLRLTLRQPG